MSKKQYYIIFGTIAFFVILLITLLLLGNKNNWQKQVLKTNNYNITMENCNNRKTEFPKESVKKLFEKWNKLSDNGPWTGDKDSCYSHADITYEKDGIVQTIKIYLIDDNSLVLNINNVSRYYVNSEKVNKYLNELFETY